MFADYRLENTPIGIVAFGLKGPAPSGGPLCIGQTRFESLEGRILLGDAIGQGCVLVAHQLVRAEERLEAGHFGRDRREAECGEVRTIGDQRNVCVGWRRWNAIELGDLAVGPRDVGSEALVHVSLVDQQELVPLLRIHSAIGVTSLSLAQHFRCAGGAKATHLVLQGNERSPLIGVGLNLVAQFLSRLAELGVPGDLRFCPLDDQLGTVGSVAGNQLLLLRHLRGEGGDSALLFQFAGNPFRDVGDCVRLSLARLPEAGGLLLAQLGEIDRPLTVILRVRLEDDALDFVDEPVGHPLGRTELFDELLGKIPGPRERQVTICIATVEPARRVSAASPGQCRSGVANEAARPREKGGANVLVGVPAGGRDGIAASRDHIRQGRLA